MMEDWDAVFADEDWNASFAAEPIEAEEELEDIVESINSSAYQSLKKSRQRFDDVAVRNGNPKRNQETGE